MSSKSTTILLCILTGIFLGVGSFTMYYGEGLSYFSKDPAACKNCHIMQSQFDSWQKASHHTVATCVDCHLPHDFFNKYIAKAENGYNHSTAFTFQNFHEPIIIKDKNSRILQENCLACHQAIVNDLVHGSAKDADDIRCVHCHMGVGHGEKVGLGGPFSSNEMGGTENE
ncbi:MAG: cytochrome c nitrite reductase small subunit [Calditrichae bacterium]|nr:cytochrome c nitrite reductase small subunit [Calditrichia bacterium]